MGVFSGITENVVLGAILCNGKIASLRIVQVSTPTKECWIGVNEYKIAYPANDLEGKL